MILATVNCTVSLGKRNEATDLLKKAAKMSNEKWPEVKVFILAPLTGDWDRVIWCEQSESRAAFDEYLEKRRKDTDFQALGVVAELVTKKLITSRTMNQYTVVDLAE